MLSRERAHCDKDQKSREVFSLIEETKSDLVQFGLMPFWEGGSGGSCAARLCLTRLSSGMTRATSRPAN